MPAAQPTQAKQSQPGAPKVTKSQLKGEVAHLQGDYLIVKMIPAGTYRLFQLKPGRTATIDGVVMPLNKAPLGTVLTADVTVTETPVIDRTITTLKGKVWVAAPTSVILTLENGENKQYRCPLRIHVRCGRTEARGDATASGHESHGDQDRGVAAHRDHDGRRRHGRRAEEEIAGATYEQDHDERQNEIYYKDWGKGPVSLLARMASERRYVGRPDVVPRAERLPGRGARSPWPWPSSQAWSGNDMDGYADDLAAVIETLDLKDITMVGHSTGGGEVARYIGRHGTKRVAKAVLIAAVPPTC